MLTISVLAIILAFFSFLAILMSCRILTQWHKHGQRLIEQDLALPENERQLPDFHLNRHAPDREYFLSIDLFSLSMPWLFMAFWVVTISYTILASPLSK